MMGVGFTRPNVSRAGGYCVIEAVVWENDWSGYQWLLVHFLLGPNFAINKSVVYQIHVSQALDRNEEKR